HSGSVVSSVAAGEGGGFKDAGGGGVVGVAPGPANALVDHLPHGHHPGDAGLPLHLHAYLDEGCDNAGVLADGTMAFGAHARVDENLGDSVFSCWPLLEFIGACEVGDVVDRVIEADVLKCVRDATNEVVLVNRC